MPPSDELSDPGDRLSERIIDELEQSTDRDLRAVIQYAQNLLHQRHDVTPELAAREGEEILRMTDHGPYTLVVVKRTDETGPDQGPFLYRVTTESGIDPDDDETVRWQYLGRVEE